MPTSATSSKAIPPDRTFAARRPALAAEWHPSLNEGITPHDVTISSEQIVWWRCSKGHAWRARVAARVGGSGCHVCAGYVVVPETSLATRFPGIAAEWHPTRNGALRPEDVTAGSSRRVIWRCSRDPRHEWRATVSSRTGHGAGCRACLGYMTTGAATLAITHPEIAAEWHPTRNDGLTASDVVAGAARLAWWRCARDPAHEWRTEIQQRARRGTGCPICSKSRPRRRPAAGAVTLASRHPEIAAEWHPSRNGERTAASVAAGSQLRAWWLCERDPSHQWQAIVRYRVTSGNGCPLCRKARSQALE